MRNRIPVAVFYWIVLLLISSNLLAVPKIASISFRNNAFYSERELLEVLPLKVNALFEKDALRPALDQLTLHYHRNGFYLFTLDSVSTTFDSDSTFVSLIFVVSEGPQTLISRISFKGNTVFSDNTIRSYFETVTGSVLRQDVLENDIHSVLQLYNNNGYPFAKILVDSVRVDSADYSKLYLSLTTEEGAKTFLNEVNITGNTSTKSFVIAREVRLTPFEIFRQEKVDRIRKRLERMQLFSAVEEPQLFITSFADADSAVGGLRVTVHEGNTNSFDGVVGYVPPPDEQRSGYFTGNVFVSMRNMFGTGRKMMVRWQRETETTQELEARYFEPWIFDEPVGLGLSYFQRKQDSSYVKNKIDLRGEFNVTEELSLALSLSSESVYPSSSSQHFTVFASDAVLFGGDIHYDTRDNYRNPTSGIRYSTSYQRGTKHISGPSQYLYLATQRNFTLQKITIDAEIFTQLFPRNIAMLGVHGRQIISSQLEVSDMFQLGGTYTVRGYRENQFFGSAMVWTSTEYRLLTGRASNVFVFFDGGYYSKPRDDLRAVPAQESFLYGYGIGAHVESSLGVIVVSFALGKGDTFSNGKIHFGITNEF